MVEQSVPDPYGRALLRGTLAVNGNPPCVWLDQEVRSRNPLCLFGYPDQGMVQMIAAPIQKVKQKRQR